jgi:hypothetical protein
LSPLSLAVTAAAWVVPVALAILLTCLCESAAAVPLVGLEVATGTTPTTGENPKSAPAICPPGKVAIAGGGDVTPGNGRVLIEAIRPGGPGISTSFAVHAIEDEVGTLDPWYVQAYAICAYPPAGLQRVTATSPLSSAGKSVTATCPAGKRVLGTGPRSPAPTGRCCSTTCGPTRA